MKKCLRILDKRTDDLRVKSEVLADSALTLHKIIFDAIGDDDNSKLAANFRYFVGMIDEWHKATDNSTEALLNLIGNLIPLERAKNIKVQNTQKKSVLQEFCSSRCG